MQKEKIYSSSILRSYWGGGAGRRKEQEKAGARSKVWLCLSFSPTLISNDHNAGFHNLNVMFYEE